MNGVEAAASLFGSEESGSDPFATLGTETTESTSLASPQSLADDLFFNNTSAPSQETEAFSFPPHSHDRFTEASAFSEYPPVATHAQNLITLSNAQHGSATSAYSEDWAGNNMTSGYGGK